MSENEQQQPQQPEPINRQKNDNDLRLLKFCCAYQESVDCQLQNVRKYCGQEGLRFFEHYMSEMTNSLINQHCAGYTYSDKCKRLRRRPHNHNHNNNHQHRGSLDHHQSHQKSNHHHQHQQQPQLNPNRKFIYFNNSTFDRHLNYNSNQHNNEEDYDDDIDNYYDNIDNDDDDSDNQNDGDRSSIDSDSNDYHNSILSTNGSIILFDSIRINLLIILLIIIMADQ